MDERSIMTRSEVDEWIARMVKLKHRELAGLQTYQIGQRGVIDLVYNAKVLKDPQAILDLEAHLVKSIKIVEDDDEAEPAT
jgi:hypothetical protein